MNEWDKRYSFSIITKEKKIPLFYSFTIIIIFLKFSIQFCLLDFSKDK